jgi:hypothetical protein
MTEIQLVILIAQVIIALLSYFTIYRHRVIYGINTKVLRMPRGTQNDTYITTEDINKSLGTGEYTVLQIVERPDKDLEIILGQIKRSKKS